MDSEGGASLPSGPDAKKRRVSYFYEPTVGDYYYGQGHPMKPHRIRMAHNLVVHYGLHRRMEINRPFPAGPIDIRRFHADDYVDFLASVTPETLADSVHSRHLKRFNVGEDCPVFDGLFGFCQASAGGSIGAAVKLNRQDADIAVNWAGGLHHAKKAEASGFCYVNDIVLGILELLKVHRRVLYVDIDVHHGDGVEEAFYTTDRVMTVSFHKFGDFFPGTGHIKDVGAGTGKNYALNVPLNDGMDDESFRSLFRPILQKVMEMYQPDAVVLQCGADSLSGDRLGCFNLSVRGHADCLRFLRSFNVPLMVLGGGGYTIRNVARCWCYETAVAVGVEPDNNLPYNEYYEYFGPDYTLHIAPSNMENLNTPKDMEKIRNALLEQLTRIPHTPSVPFQTTPPTTKVPEEVEEKLDERPKPRIWNGDIYDSDPDDDKHWTEFPTAARQHAVMDVCAKQITESKKQCHFWKIPTKFDREVPIQFKNSPTLSILHLQTSIYPPKHLQNHSSSTHGRPNPNPPTTPPGNQDPGRWHPREDVKILAKFKSMHNYIRVLEVSKRANDPFAGSRLLLLDNPGNIHSISFIFKSLTSTYFGVFATLPPIIPPGPIGILGFRTGSVARSNLDLYPEVVVRGWELDPSVIGVGREYFGLSQLERQYTDRLIIHVGDAFKASTRGGSCVEAEDSLRHGKLIMEETLKEMQRVFGDKLFVLSLGNR